MATVRHAPSGGLNVRSTPAGNKDKTLNAGDLMYDIPGVSPVEAELGNTKYKWIKVHYYKSGTTTEDGEGWVTEENTTIVSPTAPTKSDTISSSAYLKQNEMLINARYIYKYLTDAGWTSNAIFATLGNMEAESKINPGVTNSSSGAYGLVQWKPASKLTDWLTKEGKGDKSDIANQLSRIVYEAENEEQWQKKLSPYMTFAEYIASTKTCAALAEYFLKCYERPSNTGASVVAARQSHANKWSTLIGYLA